MSHKNKKTLRQQANERMNSIFCPGSSKHDVKLEAREDFARNRKTYEAMGINEKEHVDACLREKIFSYSTYENYAKHQDYFLDWCRENHKCKTLEDCRSHVNDWLQERVDEGKSSYTLKLEAASLAKLYGEASTNFIELPERDRSEITRSREDVVRDYGFSETNNAEIISFCQGTGLRRSELMTLTGSQLVFQDGQPFLDIVGKGGRERLAPIVGDAKNEIVQRCEEAGDGLVWQSVPSHMDVHAYRAEYATKIYEMHERPLDEISREERYFCRGELKGTVYDREALKEASEALGHSRVSVVAEHYIRAF